MRPPRFRLRTLLIAVAVFALGIAIADRRARFERLSSEHRRLYGEVDLLRGDAPPGRADLLQERARWHRLMSEKYRQAAEAPWLPIDPDPPYPDY